MTSCQMDLPVEGMKLTTFGDAGVEMSMICSPPGLREVKRAYSLPLASVWPQIPAELEMTPAGWNLATWVMFDWRACPCAIAAPRAVPTATLISLLPIAPRAFTMPILPEDGIS